MKNTNTLAYILMLIGTLLLFIHDSLEPKNQYLLIGGLSFLIVGIYNLAKKLPPKNPKDFQEPFVKTEKEK